MITFADRPQRWENSFACGISKINQHQLAKLDFKHLIDVKIRITLGDFLGLEIGLMPVLDITGKDVGN